MMQRTYFTLIIVLISHSLSAMDESKTLQSPKSPRISRSPSMVWGTFGRRMSQVFGRKEKEESAKKDEPIKKEVRDSKLRPSLSIRRSKSDSDLEPISKRQIQQQLVKAINNYKVADVMALIPKLESLNFTYSIFDMYEVTLGELALEKLNKAKSLQQYEAAIAIAELIVNKEQAGGIWVARLSIPESERKALQQEIENCSNRLENIKIAVRQRCRT